MRFSLIKHLNGARILHVDGDQCLVAHGLRLLIYENGKKQRVVGFLPASLIERFFSFFTFTRLGLRLGIHAALPLNDGRYLVVLKQRIVVIEQNGSTHTIDKIHRGNKPASRAICRLPEGSIVYGEYLLNKDRLSPVAIYRSDKLESGFNKIYEFSSGEVRHIHFIQWDPFELCLWMGTGDSDIECNLFKSTDKGKQWTRVGGGSQEWRAVSVIFTDNSLFWGTDAGSDAGSTPNYIVRYDRVSRSISPVQQVQGPCHGSGMLSDGSMFITTGVEGGINEVDESAHLWVSSDGNNWIDVYSRLKKKWPHIIQFGVMRVPPGCETGTSIHFTGLALQGAAESWFCGVICSV